jgi:hypothetical protein
MVGNVCGWSMGWVWVVCLPFGVAHMKFLVHRLPFWSLFFLVGPFLSFRIICIAFRVPLLSLFLVSMSLSFSSSYFYCNLLYSLSLWNLRIQQTLRLLTNSIHLQNFILLTSQATAPFRLLPKYFNPVFTIN